MCRPKDLHRLRLVAEPLFFLESFVACLHVIHDLDELIPEWEVVITVQLVTDGMLSKRQAEISLVDRDILIHVFV